MSFLNPSVLFGLAAVSIPVAIHLIHRFRVRRVEWAAMRFLQAGVQRTRRRLKMQDLLLLLLRCLLVALLALAFARPAIKSLLAGSGAGEPGTTVVLLDDSASMGQSDGVRTRFDQARDAVGRWLDALPVNSRVALYAVSNVAEALVGKPSPDLAQLRRALQLAEPGDRGSDLAAGVRAAFQVLRTAGPGPREIRVYTDGQATAWTHLDEIRTLQADNPGVRLTPVVFGRRGEDNLGITGLDVEGGIPALDQPAGFRVRVANFGARPAENVRVTLAPDDDAPADQKVIPLIEPGATRFADLFVRFARTGPHSVTAAIPADRFAADNQRAVAVQVVKHLSALLLEGNGAAPRAERDGYFLANALVPLAREQAADNYLQVASAPLAGFKPDALAPHEFVFLCNPGAVTPALGNALASYVAGGGNLVIFPGPLSDPAAWKRVPAFWDLLPAAVLDRKDAGPDDAPLAWQSRGFSHPVTSLWEDRAQGSLATVTATRYFPLQPKPAGAARAAAAVVVAYADGQPAVVTAGVGRGHVVLFSSTATPEWNNLPLHPAFVPIVQRLLGYLRREDGARLAFAPGETFVTPVARESLGGDFSVIRPGPDGTKHLAGKVELEGERAIIRYADTAAAGVYRVFLRDETPVAVFAVQLDAAESDLRQEDAATLAALAVAPAPVPGAPVPAGRHALVTREFWTPLLWLAAIVTLAEAVLAHRFSHAR